MVLRRRGERTHRTVRPHGLCGPPRSHRKPSPFARRFGACSTTSSSGSRTLGDGRHGAVGRVDAHALARCRAHARPSAARPSRTSSCTPSGATCPCGDAVLDARQERWVEKRRRCRLVGWEALADAARWSGGDVRELAELLGVDLDDAPGAARRPHSAGAPGARRGDGLARAVLHGDLVDPVRQLDVELGHALRACGSRARTRACASGCRCPGGGPSARPPRRSRPRSGSPRGTSAPSRRSAASRRPTASPAGRASCRVISSAFKSLVMDPIVAECALVSDHPRRTP